MVYPPPGLAREDWKIVRALGEFVGVELPYGDGDEIAERVRELVPSQLDEVTTSTVSNFLNVRSYSALILLLVTTREDRTAASQNTRLTWRAKCTHCEARTHRKGDVH